MTINKACLYLLLYKLQKYNIWVKLSWSARRRGANIIKCHQTYFKVTFWWHNIKSTHSNCHFLFLIYSILSSSSEWQNKWRLYLSYTNKITNILQKKYFLISFNILWHLNLYLKLNCASPQYYFVLSTASIVKLLE